MIITLLFIILLFLLIFIPSIIFCKLWWIPLHIQRILESQGIKGPPYEFFHGNTKEIIKMMNQTSNTSMELSHDILPRLLPHFYSWIQIYGNNFVYWVGTKPHIVVTEPELIKEILSNKDGTYPVVRRKDYLKKLSGNGILASDGEKWSKLRKLSNHAFHGECLKDMVPAMVDSVETMLEKWRYSEGKEIEVSQDFRLLTSEVISRTAFGSSYLEGMHIFQMLKKLCVLISRNANKIKFYAIKYAFSFFIFCLAMISSLSRVFSVIFSLLVNTSFALPRSKSCIRLRRCTKLVRTQDDIEADKIEQLLKESIMKIVKKREDEVKSGRVNCFGTDFLGSLLEAHHNSDMDQKKRISGTEIIDECKTFYFAGQETTFSLLSWSILLLAIHTDWQDKARTEVLQLFGQQNPTSEGIARLKTVSMIIYETLRLYSPVTALARRIDHEVRLGKYQFPANVNLVIPPLALHRNPCLWGEDAHLFKPERFSGGLSKAANGNSMAFLPFGYGPRTCVGLNFALNEAKITLSMILQRYRFVLSPNYVHSPCKVITVQPQHGVGILLKQL